LGDFWGETEAYEKSDEKNQKEIDWQLWELRNSHNFLKK